MEHVSKKMTEEHKNRELFASVHSVQGVDNYEWNTIRP